MGNSLSNKTIVVVGAGYVGTEVATILDCQCCKSSNTKIILIEPQDATHHKLATLRGSVVPGWELATRIKLDKLLKNGQLIQNSVKSVTNTSVTLNDDTVINADYIVLCHGAGAMLFPLSPLENTTDSESVMKLLKQNQEIIKNANNIIIIGGGPVGIEFAGEILSYNNNNNNKKVTIIHNNNKLLNNSNPPIFDKVIEQTITKLKKMKCEIKLNVKITDELNTNNGNSFIVGNKEYNLSDGSKITADLVIVCIGKFNKRQNILSNEYLNDKGQVKVNEFLQVDGLTNVFCCGDANNHPETKLAFTGANQGKHAIKNIKALASNKSLIPYKGLDKEPYGAMFLPLGPNIGVGAFGTNVFSDNIIRLVKGKSLFSKKQFEIRHQVFPETIPIV